MEKYKIPNEKSIKRRVVEKSEILDEKVGFFDRFLKAGNPEIR